MNLPQVAYLGHLTNKFMIFKVAHLQGIKDGRITLAYRKWKRPSVKKGTVLKTAVGLVEIMEISQVDIDLITKQDAKLAGYHSLDQLLSALQSRAEGIVYQMLVRYVGEDPRIELRNSAMLTQQEFDLVAAALARMDRSSKAGPWTKSTLVCIHDFPQVKAQDLAIKLNSEKIWLKTNIRKLKNLGLTISHEIGYSLSPRGVAYLEKIKG